jgi:hypothetical protein
VDPDSFFGLSDTDQYGTYVDSQHLSSSFFFAQCFPCVFLPNVNNQNTIFQELVVPNESLDSADMSRNLMDEIFGTSLTRDQDEEGQQQDLDMDNMAHAPETLRDPAQPLHDAHDRTGLDLNRSLDLNRVSDLRRSKRHEGEARVNNGRQDQEGLEDTQEEDIGIEEGGEQQVDHPMVLLDNVTSPDDSQQEAGVNSFTPPDAVGDDDGATAGGSTAGGPTAAVGAGPPAIGLVSPGIRESEPPPGAAKSGPGDGDREESDGETDEGREESDSGGLPGLLSSPGADAEEKEGAGAGVERVETSDHEELARENITVVGE